uniref:C2 domain-containing protein n=1 Tax=Syphacia muris TaxID=451379 RepID=A0A158R601_9BILA
MHEMSKYSSIFLEPGRRRLPPTPTRRSSSPRILPTPPPISPELRSPSATFERPPSRRRLPVPPVVTEIDWPFSFERKFSETQTNCISINECKSVSTPVSTPVAEFVAEPAVETVVEPIVEPIVEPVIAPVTVTGPVTVTVQQQQRQSPKQLQHPQLEEQQQESSHEHSGGTPSSTNAPSQSSSLSPSIEQLASKSSSEGEDLSILVSHGIDPSLYQRTAIASSSSVPDIINENVVPSSSSWPENEPRPSGLGYIQATLQHFPIRKRLRVSILKAEGLAGQLKPDLELHAYCKVALVPGGKTQNSIVKRGRNVVFNQEFFFNDISAEDLVSKDLNITVCHQVGQKLQKDAIIGDVYVPLKRLNELRLKKEVKIVEELKYSFKTKKLGKIYTTSCIEKAARRLTINVIKAEDLPKGGITGPPDVCVRIRVTQGGTSQTKQTRVLKNTSTAVYKEAVMFLIKTSKEILKDTSIIISVHDLSRTVTGDDLIGLAYLGRNAQDKSEIEQWKNTSEHLGKEYKGVHHLKPTPQAPDVQVEHAPSDSE